MKSAAKFQLVFVTAPNLKTARALSRAALDARLIACANILPAVESHYWWQGKIQAGKEVLIIFKTSRAMVPKLEKLVLKLHPYDTPEIITIPLESGTAKYLDWIESTVGE